MKRVVESLGNEGMRVGADANTEDEHEDDERFQNRRSVHAFSADPDVRLKPDATGFETDLVAHYVRAANGFSSALGP